MNKISVAVFVVSVAMIIMSCSSDSDAPSPLEDPIGDISGGWSIFETFSSSTSECNDTEGYDVAITQNVNSITVTGDGGVATGTLSGSSLSLAGSRTTDLGVGTATYISITAPIPSDCSSFNAEATWTYTEPGFSCTGTSTMSANRTSGGTTC